MRVPGVRRLGVAFRWLRGRFGSRALILGYHRVTAERPDPFGVSVSPARFDEQLEVVARRARPMSLTRLLEASREGRVPHGAVAVTFDDGYADLLYAARPRLERHGIPATAFLVSGCLGEELWWDRLHRLVRSGVGRGRPLRVALPEGEFLWHDGQGRAEEESGRLLSELYTRLCPLPDPARREALAAVAEWADGAVAEVALVRTLRPDEVLEMVQGEVVEIGAHSQSHPDLTELDADSMRAEIHGCRAQLRSLVGREVAAFSYPFGRTSLAVSGQVREAGFSWACSSRNDLLRAGEDAYGIPRFWPGDWDGGRFERWLRLWLGR